jgi:Domain of unknown function (DUF4386)
MPMGDAPLVPVLSPRLKARIAGALYVLCIACGLFAEMIVRSKLIVYSDAAATAQNILAAPTLYRLGFFADVAAMMLGVLSSLIMYTLFKVVSRGLALTALALDVISNTVSICGSVLLFAPLVILRGGGPLPAFSPAELQWLALLSVKMYELAYAMNLAIFSGSCLITGYLIFRSTFLPKVLGVLLAIAGLCYLINSFVSFMPQGFGDFLFPWILLPVILGEGALALWLLFVGVDSSKWNEIAEARPAS